MRHCEFKKHIELKSSEDAYNRNKTDLDKEAIFLPTKKIAALRFFPRTEAATVAATTAAATTAILTDVWLA